MLSMIKANTVEATPIYVWGYPAGYAQAGELYELGDPALQSEGLVDIVFPNDALRVVLLEPSFPDVGQLGFHRRHRGLSPFNVYLNLTFISALKTHARPPSENRHSVDRRRKNSSHDSGTPNKKTNHQPLHRTVNTHPGTSPPSHEKTR